MKVCVLRERNTGYEMVVDCNSEEFNKLCTEHPDTEMYLPLVVQSYPVTAEPACYHFLFSKIPDWIKHKA